MDTAHEKAVEFVRQVKQNAIETDCHTIVLSCETIYPTGGRDVGTLHSVLRKITTDIQPVLYVREPADWYRSNLQQNSKNGYFLLPNPPLLLKSPLEKLEQEFGSPPIVRAYHRDQLPDNEILQDFCQGVLHLDLATGDLPKLRENRSLSAEETFLLLTSGELFGSEHLGRREMLQIDDEITESFQAGRRIRAKIGHFSDTDDRLTKLRLRPALVHAIRSSATEYIWLKERFGISFREINYSKISADRKALEGFRSPLDIFEIDNQALAWLAVSVMQEILTKRPGEPQATESPLKEDRRERPLPFLNTVLRRLKHSLGRL